MPATKLRAVGKVGVLGKRVVLPAAGVFDGGAAPDASSAVEIEKKAAAESRGVFDDEVTVEKNSFHFGERGIVTIHVAPARLRHRQLCVGKVRDGAAEEICRGNEIGVENGDEFAGRGFQPLLECASLEAFAI